MENRRNRKRATAAGKSATDLVRRTECQISSSSKSQFHSLVQSSISHNQHSATFNAQFVGGICIIKVALNKIARCFFALVSL